MSDSDNKTAAAVDDQLASEVDEIATDIDTIQALVRSLDEDILEILIRAATYVGVASGPIDSDLPASVIRQSTVKLGKDQAYYFFQG
jgi:hypothetical protein